MAFFIYEIVHLSINFRLGFYYLINLFLLKKSHNM